MSKGSWKTRGCYLWRTRKPHALFGWSLRWCLLAGVAVGLLLWALHGWWWIAFAAPFFSGRHTAYIGQTSSRYFRDKQHVHGDTRYGAASKPWADLDPKVYPLPVLIHRWKWAREGQETLYIKLLCPVYNDKKQPRWNLRKISSTKAEQQRWARAKRGQGMRLAVAAARLVFAAGVWAAIGWGAWFVWTS